uniref:Putative plant transposon protein domain-containing protein n=1 Tax=Cannabis sativa TaxID=3483 RepID=A0A803QF89_CANSA
MPRTKQMAYKKLLELDEDKRFTTPEAKTKYNQFIQNKEFYIEHGLITKIDELGHLLAWLAETIKARKWELFVWTPELARRELVKEFYANFLNHQWPIIVQGVKVPFNAKVINKYCGLKRVECQYLKSSKNITNELIRDILPELAKPKAEWEIDENGNFQFRRTDLQH